MSILVMLLFSILQSSQSVFPKPDFNIILHFDESEEAENISVKSENEMDLKNKQWYVGDKEYVCHYWTFQEERTIENWRKKSIFSHAKMKVLCETFGKIYTEGNEQLAPGCAGCSCCQKKTEQKKLGDPCGHCYGCEKCGEGLTCARERRKNGPPTTCQPERKEREQCGKIYTGECEEGLECVFDPEFEFQEVKICKRKDDESCNRRQDCFKYGKKCYRKFTEISCTCKNGQCETYAVHRDIPEILKWGDVCDPCYGYCPLAPKCKQGLRCGKVRFPDYPDPQTICLKTGGQTCNDKWGPKCEEGLACPIVRFPGEHVSCQKVGRTCNDKWGPKCEEGLVCSIVRFPGDRVRCQKALKEGEPCNDKWRPKCEDGLVCPIVRFPGEHVTCQKAPKEGEFCNDKWGPECEDGLYCNSNVLKCMKFKWIAL